MWWQEHHPLRQPFIDQRVRRAVGTSTAMRPRDRGRALLRAALGIRAHASLRRMAVSSGFVKERTAQ